MYVFRDEAHDIISIKLNEGLTNYNKSEEFKVMEFNFNNKCCLLLLPPPV